MNPDNNNPQGENPNLQKLEEDLQKLSQTAQPTAPTTSPVPTVPTVEEPIITPTTPPPPLVHEVPKPGSSLSKIAMLLIVIAVLAIAAYFVGTKFLGQRSVAIPTPVVTSTPTSTPDVTANWKIYRSESLGFEIKYPSVISMGEEFNDQNNRGVELKSEETNIWIDLEKAGDTELKNYYYLDNPIKSTAQMGGQTANVYESETGYCDGPVCSKPFIAYVTRKGSDFYIVEFQGDVELSGLENQILSTFKFLGASPTASASASPTASPKVSPTTTPIY